MSFLKMVLYGRVTFDAYEEYSAFQHHFLGILLVFNMLSSTLFLLAEAWGLNHLPHQDLLAIRVHLAVAVVCFLLVRNWRRAYLPVCVVFGGVCIYVCTAALVWVPSDELRILWFFLLPPAFYLLLGRGAGVASTVLSLAIIAVGNRHSVRPYSPNAIATGFIGMLYISAFFYAWSERARTFFQRLRESREALAHMASHDPLTGAYNARAYYEISERLLLVAHRERTPSSVLFVDLDHFKKVNDTWGHEAGDAVLRRAVDVLHSTARRSDVVGRVGGEEFALFLPDTGREGALVLAEKLRRAISAGEVAVGAAAVRVTASIGVAVDSGDAPSIAHIHRQADEAMYAAKREGRDRVCVLFEGVCGAAAT